MGRVRCWLIRGRTSLLLVVWGYWFGDTFVSLILSEGDNYIRADIGLVCSMTQPNFNAVRCEDKEYPHISKNDVYDRYTHEQTPSDPPTGSHEETYEDGQPYVVWSRTQSPKTKAILYDPKSELYAVASTTDADAVWAVSSIGDTVVGEHIEHTDEFDERAIDWWETDAMMELVYDGHGFYADGSFGLTEFASVDELGSISLRIVAE